MELTAIIIFGIACFALGMYFTTQISEWISDRTQHKKFIKNLENYGKEKNTQRTKTK